MNKKESNKVNSFNASVTVLLKNEPVWKGSVDVTNQFGYIQTRLPLVGEYDQKQNNSGKPSSVSKKGIKKGVIPMGIKLSKSAVAYAVAKKDRTLEFSVKLTKSELESMKENTLLTALLKFYNIILPLKDKLEHLNPTDMDNFGVMIENLKKALP